MEQVPASWEHHHYVNGACEYCKETNPDYFEWINLNEGGDSYWIGDYNSRLAGKMTVLVIPSFFKGLPITVLSRIYYHDDGGFFGKIKTIVIPDTIITIESSAFSSASPLEEITIGSGVLYIGGGAFWKCSSLSKVFYKGTARDWDNIEIGEGNESLLSATRYYYSETQPAEQGNYWHYGADGVTPVIWE